MPLAFDVGNKDYGMVMSDAYLDPRDGKLWYMVTLLEGTFTQKQLRRYGKIKGLKTTNFPARAHVGSFTADNLRALGLTPTPTIGTMLNQYAYTMILHLVDHLPPVGPLDHLLNHYPAPQLPAEIDAAVPMDVDDGHVPCMVCATMIGVGDYRIAYSMNDITITQTRHERVDHREHL